MINNIETYLKEIDYSLPVESVEINRGWTIKYKGINVVYLLANQDDIVYAGSSNNLQSRMGGHNGFYKKDYCTVYIMRCESREEAYTIEDKLIWKYKPKHNKRRINPKKTQLRFGHPFFDEIRSCYSANVAKIILKIRGCEDQLT